MPLDASVKLQMLQERFKSTSEKFLIESLNDALVIIATKLEATTSLTEKKRLKAIEKLIDEQITAIFKEVTPYIQDDMVQFAEVSHNTLFTALNTSFGVGYAYVSPTNTLINAIKDLDSIVLMGDKGYTINALIKSANENQVNRFKRTMASGVAANTGYREIVKSLKDDVSISQKEIQAIIHTAISSARDKADAQVYKRFDSLIKGWESVATLDSRTTLQCASLDGKKYYKSSGYEYDKIPNKPPRHFRCRSVLVPITKSEDATRSQSGDTKGQIDAKTKFPEWFSNQSEKFQKGYLGKSRYDLYKKNKLPISSFVDIKTGEKFTIKELQAMI